LESPFHPQILKILIQTKTAQLMTEYSISARNNRNFWIFGKKSDRYIRYRNEMLKITGHHFKFINNSKND
jgi:hypothetical protein